MYICCAAAWIIMSEQPGANPEFFPFRLGKQYFLIEKPSFVFCIHTRMYIICTQRRLYEQSYYLLLQRASQAYKKAPSDRQYYPYKTASMYIYTIFCIHQSIKTTQWCTHCTENPIFNFPEMKLCGLVPNSYIHVSVIYIFPGWSVCLFGCS